MNYDNKYDNPKKFNQRKDFKGFKNGNTVRRNPNYLNMNNPHLCKWIGYRKIEDPYIKYMNRGEYKEVPYDPEYSSWNDIVTIPRKYHYCTTCNQRPCKSIEGSDWRPKSVMKTKLYNYKFACQ